MSRPPAPTRRAAPWLTGLTLLLLACQADDVSRTPGAADDRTGRGDVPTVTLRHPLGTAPNAAATVVCDQLTAAYEGDDGSGGSGEIAGYQVKLVASVQTTSIDDARDLLSDGLECGRNLLIPDHLVVDDGVPLTDSTYHACDWYPKAEALHADTLFDVGELTEFVSLFAVRTHDVDGNVTPPSAYAFATAEAEGNLVKLIRSSLQRSWPVTVYERTLDRSWTLQLGEQESRLVEIPADVPLDLDWAGTRPVCGAPPAIEYAYAIDIPDPDCAACTDPDGIGGWSPFGVDEIPFPLVFGEETIGETHTVHIKARDLGFDPPDTEVQSRLDFVIYGGGFERPALWVDDFILSGLDDCTHDAIVGPWLDSAVRPYVRAQEGIAQWLAHPPTPVPCVEQTIPVAPSREDLLRFRMAFWNVSAGSAGSALGELTDRSSPNGRVLTQYVQAGGGFVVWGRGTIGAMVGDDYPPSIPHTPALPQFPLATFGPGDFLWDVMRLRTSFDRVGRGTSQRLSRACSGLIGLEATPTAIAEGYPVGALDPSGYSTDPTNTAVTPKTAIWFDDFEGRQNRFGADADAPTGVPPLHVAGMDTLYTYVSNSWTYLEDGSEAVREVCGTSFPSPFEGEPIVIRYDGGAQGRVVWIGAELRSFAASHDEDVRLLMEKLIAWVLEEA